MVTTKPDMTRSLTIGEITVSGNSVSAAVFVCPPDLKVSEKLADTILSMRPTLAEHTCKNRGFGFFGDKIVGTTLPHLIEHLAIDFLVEESQKKADAIAETEHALIRGDSDSSRDETESTRSDSDSTHGDSDSTHSDSAAIHDGAPRAIAGITRWLNHNEGRMQIKISCTARNVDETCRAITRAIDVVNSLLEP